MADDHSTTTDDVTDPQRKGTEDFRQRVALSEAKNKSEAFIINAFRGTLTGDDLDKRLVSAWNAFFEKESKANRNGSGAVPETIDLQTVASKKVRWIWQGRFPRGKLTVIDGDPGLGKSLLGCDFAARHSNGSDWPDGMPCPQGNTMLITYEDGLDDTVKPRLEAANADFANGRLIVLTQIQDKQGVGYHLPSIPSDMQAIKAHCVKHRIELLIIDPFMAALDDQVDAWNDKKMRKAMAPLAAMAQLLGITVVIIRHLNKKESVKNPLYRGGGAISTVAAARAAFIVAPDLTDPTLMVMASQKGNLSRAPVSLTFRIEERFIPIEREPTVIPIIQWEGESQYTAAQLLSPISEPTKKGRAKELLLTLFTENLERPSKEVYDLGKKKAWGLSEDTILRAANELGFISSQRWEPPQNGKGKKVKVGYMRAPARLPDPFESTPQRSLGNGNV